MSVDLCFNTSHVVIYQNGTLVDRATLRSFNTFHVVIYLQKRDSSGINENGFNTSHVVIYQTYYINTSWLISVSIHLMLLFIPGL